MISQWWGPTLGRIWFLLETIKSIILNAVLLRSRCSALGGGGDTPQAPPDHKHAMRMSRGREADGEEERVWTRVRCSQQGQAGPSLSPRVVGGWLCPGRKSFRVVISRPSGSQDLLLFQGWPAFQSIQATAKSSPTIIPFTASPDQKFV